QGGSRLPVGKRRRSSLAGVCAAHPPVESAISLLPLGGIAGAPSSSFARAAAPQRAGVPGPLRAVGRRLLAAENNAETGHGRRQAGALARTAPRIGGRWHLLGRSLLAIDSLKHAAHAPRHTCQSAAVDSAYLFRSTGWQTGQAGSRLRIDRQGSRQARVSGGRRGELGKGRREWRRAAQEEFEGPADRVLPGLWLVRHARTERLGGGN